MNKVINLKQNYSFKFHPMQFVMINYLGIKIEGRIQKCIWLSGDRRLYEVNFIDQGIFHNYEFWEDELEAKNGNT